MKITNGIKAFEDYWVECQYSTDLSVLTSIYPHLKNELFSFSNEYTYELIGYTPKGSQKFYNVEAKPARSLRDGFETEYRSNINDTEKLIKKIRQLVRRRKYVYVGIDLFYSLPNTITWQKFHWQHYTFVTGYDRKKDEFYILESTFTEGFKEYAIPTERFKQAITSCDFENKVFSNKLIKGYVPEEVTVEDIKRNAENIVKSIEARDGMPMYHMDDDDYENRYFEELGGQHLFIIMNQQMSNKRMFSIMNEKGYLSNDKAGEYERTCEELIRGWNAAKISFFKLYSRSADTRGGFIDALNTYVESLLAKEKDMWLDCISYIENHKVTAENAA